MSSRPLVALAAGLGIQGLGLALGVDVRLGDIFVPLRVALVPIVPRLCQRPQGVGLVMIETAGAAVRTLLGDGAVMVACLLVLVADTSWLSACIVHTSSRSLHSPSVALVLFSRIFRQLTQPLARSVNLLAMALAIEPHPIREGCIALVALNVLEESQYQSARVACLS